MKKKFTAVAVFLTAAFTTVVILLASCMGTNGVLSGVDTTSALGNIIGSVLGVNRVSEANKSRFFEEYTQYQRLSVSVPRQILKNRQDDWIGFVYQSLTTEGRRILGVHILRGAAPGIPCKKLERVCPDLRRCLPHGEETSGGGQMAAQSQYVSHGVPPPSGRTGPGAGVQGLFLPV